MGFVGNAVQGDFERDRDLLFDLFSGMAGPLRDDLRVSVGDVGIRFDGQITKRNDAPDEQHQRHAEYQDAIAQREIDEQTNHLPCSEAAAENASASATSSSPTFAPWRICCRPSERPAVCTSSRRKELALSLRKIQSLSCRRMMAVAGTTRCGFGMRERKVATAYIPGRKAPSRLASTMRTLAARVLGSRTRETSLTLPLNTWSGKAFRRTSAGSPMCTSPRSFS